ncbi:MAG: YbbR-like domain-containing protein, partial [Candidatus Rokubacteria bacterium]|nr:YbbR-like domain-containing protein [Candidatus Rokubacteria bacterium]
GTTVDRIVVDPAAVQVEGPRSTIETKDAVETLPVNVAGRRSTLTQSVGLALPEFVYPTRDRSVQVIVEITPEASMAGRQQRSGR